MSRSSLTKNLATTTNLALAQVEEEANRMQLERGCRESERGQLLDSPAYRMSHSVMTTLRKMCRCPLVDGPYLKGRKRRALSQTSETEHIQIADLFLVSDAYRESGIRHGVLSDALLAAYLLSCAHFCLYVYHQYKLDWNLVRMDYLKFMQMKAKFNRHPVSDELLKQLGDVVEHESAVLGQLGHPTHNMTFFGLLVYCLEFLFPFFGYFSTQVIFSIFQPFDQYILRILLDYDRELELCRLLVDGQVDEFLVSHRNFTKTVSISCADHLDRRKQYQALDEAQKLLEHDRFIEDDLLAMKDRNRLMPANRQVAWIQSWLKPHLAITLSCFTIGFACTWLIVALVYFLPMLKPDEPQPWLNYDLADWLVIGETSIFLFTLNCAVSFYGATLTFSALDQLWLASQLSESHEKFLLNIGRMLRRVKSTHSISVRDLSDQLEHDIRRKLNIQLMELLMNFRIFSKQLASQREIFGFNAASLTPAFFLVPVMCRLHAPYFDPNLSQEIKTFLAIVSTMTLVPMSFMLLVPCAMFSRCVDLHRAQVRLLAHIIQVNQLYPNLFNSHLAVRLRRETSSYDRLVEQFAFSFSGFRFTYASILRLYFWFGALILSSMFRPSTITASLDPKTGKLTRHYSLLSDTGLLDDPFGILNWSS